MLRPSRRSRFGVVGHEMGPTQPEQLDPVLQRAEELVRILQSGAVATPDVAAFISAASALSVVRTAQRLIAAAVDELQQLHRELDVAQAARRPA